MLIDKIFIDEYKAIKERIENMPIEKCARKYENYINENASDKSVDDFEREYINRLRKFNEDFIISVYRQHYNGLTKDKLIEILLESQRYGLSCLVDDLYDFDYEYFFLNYFSPKETHELIKNHMLKVLEDLYEELTISRIELERKNLQSKIETNTEKIERLKQEIDELLKTNDRMLSKLENIN